MTQRTPIRQPRRRTLTVRSRADKISVMIDYRTVVACVALIVIIVACSLVALSLGQYAVALPDVISAIFGSSTDAVHKVVVDWRLPRVLMAAVFGAALGMSGALFQSLTRNALGSPDVIGFTTGSYSGVLVTMLLGGAGYLTIAMGALVGGLVTALAVYALAYRRGTQGFRLIIVGIALGAMLTSLNSWIMIKVDVEFAMRAAIWGAGTLNGVRWEQASVVLLVMIVLCIAVSLISPRIRQLELGDEAAAAQGLAVERSKLLMIIIGIAFIALVTAAAGPIAFVALAAPQVARRLTRTSASVDLATSALVGAAMLAVADLIAQHAFPGLSLPVGAVTVCIGGLYLVWLLARETKRR